MIKRLDDLNHLPGQRPVTWRRERTPYAALACLAGAAWPPLVLTMLIWPPSNWLPGPEMDWRLLVLLIGLVATPAGLMAIKLERESSGRPTGRLGIVWRFMLYGGLLAAALMALYTLLAVVNGWFASGGLAQALGASETNVLIYGVGGLPIAMIVGVSYALWAGLCVAFIAFQPEPPAVKDRIGMLDKAPPAP